MDDLKPIGTEFWHDFPPGPDMWQKSFLYRVIAHRLVERFPGDRVGKLMEELLPVKSRERQITGWGGCQDCFSGLKYTFGGWEAQAHGWPEGGGARGEAETAD